MQDGDQAVNGNDALVVELREELNKRDELLAENTETIEALEKGREDFQIVYNTEKGKIFSFLKFLVVLVFIIILWTGLYILALDLAR